MKKLLLFCFVVFITEAIGQTKPSIYFRLDSVINFKRPQPESEAKKDTNFRGLSGIDYDFKSKIWYLISDRYGIFYQINDVNIYIQESDKYTKIQNNLLEGGESIRYVNDKIFYCVEKNDSISILGVFPDKQIETFEMSKKFKNRGFEGITLSDDGKDLFVSIESSTEQQDESPFAYIIKYKKDSVGAFSKKNKINFKYPIDKFGCAKEFNDSTGNGISEILFLKENTLLVLERCFDGHSGKVKLFEATLDSLSKIITKTEVVCFNRFGTKFIPENIEGMTWGPPEVDGSKTLYLIADDNFKDNQQTQLIRLITSDLKSKGKSNSLVDNSKTTNNSNNKNSTQEKKTIQPNTVTEAKNSRNESIKTNDIKQEKSTSTGLVKSKSAIRFSLEGYIDDFKLPTDSNFEEISGIDYDSIDKIWYLVSDKSGCYFTFQDTINTTVLKKHCNQALLGAESIRLDKRKNRIFFCLEDDESDTTSVCFLDLKDSTIHTFKEQEIKIPNRGFEGLTISSDGNRLFVSLEASKNDKIEILEFDISDPQPKYVKSYFYNYNKDTCSGSENSGKIYNGISEILYMENENFLVLERCHFKDNINKLMLYETSIIDNDSKLNKSISMNITEVFNNPKYELQNLEGMAWGPKTKDGLRTLHIFSDNNIKSRYKLQTQYLRFVEKKE